MCLPLPALSSFQPSFYVALFVMSCSRGEQGRCRTPFDPWPELTACSIVGLIVVVRNVVSCSVNSRRHWLYTLKSWHHVTNLVSVFLLFCMWVDGYPRSSRSCMPTLTLICPDTTEMADWQADWPTDWLTCIGWITEKVQLFLKRMQSPLSSKHGVWSNIYIICML